MSMKMTVSLSIATSMILALTSLAPAAANADLAIVSGSREIRVAENCLFRGRV